MNIFKNKDFTDYKSIPFWSWNNKLDKDVLRKQINDMKEAGMGGFIMHARTGLTTGYLSDDWFECVSACLDEAAKLNMNAWIYDENGWPSGFVEGRLLENHDYRAQFLEYEVKDRFDSEAFAVYSLSDGKAKRLQSGAKEQEYHCIYLRTSPANTDILNPEVVDEFIKQTHEEYYKRFAKSFGKELKGFFTDEPQYYRAQTPFTKIILDDYKKTYGGDVLDNLVYLFTKSDHGYEFRYRYYNLLSKYYNENFYKKIYDWCEDKGVMLTGHSVEEGSLNMQMWGGAGVMPSYEYQHIPGIDFLGRYCGTELMPRQVASVSQQLDKKFILTETYGCGGYDVTPYELKSAGDYQYYNGVNLMCHHLYPYSIAGQAKVDHPPVFSRHANWWEGFRVFNDYYTKLGYVIANTRDIVDIAIINPMRGVYLDYIRSLGYKSVKELEDNYNSLILKLRESGILFHIIDETVLKGHGSVNGGKLSVGSVSYGTVVLPDMAVISSFTEKILSQFLQGGGRFHAVNKPGYVDGSAKKVDLNSNIEFGEIIKNRYINSTNLSPMVQITARSGDLGEFIFVKNLSHTEEGHAEIAGLSNDYVKVDISEEIQSHTFDKLTLKPSEGLVFMKSPGNNLQPVSFSETDITGKLKFFAITDNYLVIDTAAISFDGKSFQPVKSVPQIFEELLRQDYKGDLYVRYGFNVTDKPQQLTLMMEKSRYEYVSVNGQKVTLGGSDFDINFAEFDISAAVKTGNNTIEYKIDYWQHEGVTFALFDPLATESLRNCLSYDTEIENIYLKGKFTLDSMHNICRPAEDLPVSRDLPNKGFPFFYGNVTYRFDYDYDGECQTALALEGRYVMAKVNANGKQTLVVLDNVKDITECLVKGNNTISITIYSSLRNLLGPHHFKPSKEPTGVGPYNFTMRGSWKDGESRDYNPEYSSVNFGIDSVKLRCSKV